MLRTILIPTSLVPVSERPITKRVGRTSAWGRILPTPILVASVLAIVVLAACAPDAQPGDDPGVTVIVTTTIIGDIATQIVGSNGTVEILVPTGADPHEFQPSAQQVASIQSADLVVANGLRLEEGLEDILKTGAEDGANVLELAIHLDPMPFGSEPGSPLDPHIWLDPVRVAGAGRLIAVELASVDASVDWEARAVAYESELIAADETIRDILNEIPEARRTLVTNHDSFGYFARRYEFDILGVVIPGGSTLAEPSSSELSDLVATMTNEGVVAVFTESTGSSVLAAAVAAEGRNIAVVELYSGSLGAPGSGAETLINMLITNATRIAGALS